MCYQQYYIDVDNDSDHDNSLTYKTHHCRLCAVGLRIAGAIWSVDTDP